jgi:DNA-binding protein YbaB
MISAGARYRAFCRTELLAGARDFARLERELRRLLTEADHRRRDQDTERLRGVSKDDLATVVCSGTGEVVEVDLDPARYRKVGSDAIVRAVLSAIAGAGFAETADRLPVTPIRAVSADVDDPAARDRIERIVEQYRRAGQRLAGETVTCSGPRSAAIAQYDGLGRLRGLRLHPRALIECTFPQLGDDIAAALRAGGRASEELRERVFDGVLIDGDTVANWRRHPSDPAEKVRQVFGVNGATESG